jgi:hypothetical protein
MDMDIMKNKKTIDNEFTWYISSPRAESCPSVLAAVNKDLKAYTPEARNVSEIELEGKYLTRQALFDLRKKYEFS